ncbi:MAG: hypothetical protein LUC22_06205, partial [Prevotella sp.]|nr:hypothetical protein [Prevotella sp.]
TRISSAYPAAKVLDDIRAMDFCFDILGHVSFAVASNAVAEYVCTSQYPPSIAEVRKLCADRTKEPVPAFDAAWGTVVGAIARHGSYDPEGAFAEMDDITREVVKNLGWTRLCMSENQTADRANFSEAYEARAKGAKVDTLSQITYAAPVFVKMTATNEPALAGAVAATAKGQTVKKPVAGEAGVYLFKVIDKTPKGDKYDPKNIIEPARKKAMQNSGNFMNELHNNAQVVDNRYIFF